VKRFNGDWPLLILDDVVASVDAGHKRRVASLLFQEFGDKQLLITTNDSRFFNDLRRAEAETGHEGDTKNLIIESWTLEEGPKLKDAAPAA
jgi:recombinational DNA repair ATPase RecF